VLNDKTQIKLSHPADLLTIGYQLLIMMIIIFHFRSVPSASYFLVYHAVIIVFVLWLPYAGNHNVVTWIRDWNPVLIIPTNFSELHYLVHAVNPVDFDNALIHFDYAIFGVHPTVWLEQWSHPILTEYLQWVYTTFYFLPLVTGFILYQKKAYEDFYFLVFVIVLGYYASYIGYFLVPALGPRFTLEYLQSQPVSGIWLTEAIRETLNYLENIQRDAFPSGHTAVTLLTMIYTRRYSKTYFNILMVIGTSLIISTVYLRYHYVVDVVAGIALTLLIWYLAPRLYRWFERLQNVRYLKELLSI